MSAMQPIDDDTLFTPALTPGLTATSVAPIGSVGAQTFQAQSPTAPGTTLGPSGTTLPLLTPFTTNGSPNPTLSYTSPYGGPGSSYPPAYDPDEQAYSLASGGPLAPIPTLTSPPTIYYNPATGQPFAVPATGASIIPGGTYWDPTTGQEYLIPFGGGQLPSSINSPARILTSMLPTPSTSQTPAPNTPQAGQTGQPGGPITYTTPFPTMIAPQTSTSAPAPNLMCQFGTWVQNNPGLALLATGAIYLALRRKK